MKAPQRFGPWEVLGAIAQGGQGAVLRARDPASGRAVALKLLLRSDGKALRRFKQEAQVLARLEHPGIVRVLDHGDEDGVPWLAMEMVEGEHLRARVEREGPLEASEAARLVAAMARAVSHAHAQGVVHRDLKPENVIIERETGRAVLVDFGLLRRDSEVFGELSIDAHSRLSKTGELRGTPAYMAPEQVSPAKFGGIGPGTDVYGLGGVLYYLLTGAPPHEAEGLHGLIAQILGSTASPDPARHRPSLPRAVIAEVRRALEPQPADRHPSATALAEALEVIAAGGAGPAGAARRRVLVLGLLLAGLVAAAGIAVGAWLVAHEPAARTEQGPLDVGPPGPLGGVVPVDDGARRAEAERALEALGRGSAADRLRAAREWLARYAGLPGEARAREVLRAAGREAPLLRAAIAVARGERPAPVRAVWLDAERFATWGGDRVRLWSVDDPAPLLELDAGYQGPEDVAVIGSRELVLVRRSVGVWSLRVEPRAEAVRRVESVANAHSVGVARDGRIVIGDALGGAALLAGLDGPVQPLPSPHRSAVRAARFSPDGRWLATGGGGAFEDKRSADNRFVLWDARTLALVAEHAVDTSPVSLAFSLDGRWLLVGTSGYQLWVLDLRAPGERPGVLIGEEQDEQPTGDIRGVLRGTAHRGAVRSLTFLPDGVLVSGSGESAESGAENGVRAWDLGARRELVERRRELPAAVLSVEAAPDGRLLVGTSGGEVTLWAPW